MAPQDINSQSNARPVGQDSPRPISDVDSVQSYASIIAQPYDVASLEQPLEVHSATTPQATNVASRRGLKYSSFFSRRKAMVVSTLITAIVLILTVGVMSILVRRGPSNKQQNAQTTEQKDVKIEGAINSTLPKELQGAEQSLLVNGDVVTRGNLKVSNSGFVTLIRTQNPNANQTVTLPNGSGTICLDTNNCGYGSQAVVNTLQSQLNNLQDTLASLGQITAAPVGVRELNGQTGSVGLQGSLNRIAVNTSGGVVTISTPQDLDANANVQFGSLSVSQTGEIKANKIVQTGAGNSINIDAGSDMITFTAGGRVFQLPNTGVASQTICTTGASCAAGGGTAVLLSDNTVQTDSSSNASIYINDIGGGNLLQLSSGVVPTNKLVVTNNGDTTVGGSLTVSGLTAGFVKSNGSGLLSVVNAIGLTTDVTGVLPVTSGGTGVNTIPANGVLIGNGVGAIATAVETTNQDYCLLSTAGGAPSFRACPAGSTFNLTGDSGTPEQLVNGNTINIAGGNNITTSVGATDKVTVNTVNNPTFTTSVSTPLLQSSGALSITPGGALTVGATGQTALLQGSTTTITSSAGNNIVLTKGAGGQIQFSGFNCAALGNGGKLTTDASGNISCAADNGGSGAAITGTSTQTGRLAAFTGAQTVADSWLLQNGSTIEIDNTRNLSLMGGNFSVTGTGLFSGLISANGGITVSAGNSFSLNGEAFTDLTGTGLSFSSGTLQATLGTSVDLTSEVTGVLPVTSGGTGVNGSSAANGQLLIGNGTGYTLANITAGSGITINNGAGSIQVVNAFGTSIDSAEITDLTVTNADIANSTIDLSAKTTGNYVATIAGSSQVSVGGSGSNNAAVTLGLVADSIGDSQLAFNTGQNLTTASTPGFAGLNVTGGTITVGTSSQLASMVLNDGNGQTTTLRPGDSTGNLTFTLPSADGTANQCIKTNASGVLSFGGCLNGLSGTGAVTGSGTNNKLSKFDSSGTNLVDSSITDNGTNVTTSVSMIVQGGGLTLGTALQNAALTLYGNGFTANIDASGITSNNTYNFPSGVGGDFCIKQNNNCSGSGGGNAPTTAQYLTLALDSGLSAERTLSFNGTNFSVVDNGANNSYTVNTAQNIDSTATPTFGGLTLGGVGTLTVAGLTTLNGGLTVEAGDTLTFNGDAITDLTGNGLQVTTNTLTLQVQASKGIEVDTNGISLIDCANGQILKYNTTGSQWACGADAGGSGVGDNVSVNGTGANDADFVNTTATGSVAGTSFTLNVSTPDQIKVAVSVASATIAGVVDTNAQTFAGAKTFNANITAAGGLSLGASQSLTAAGDSIQDFTGNGLQVTSNVLSVMLDSGSGLSSSSSGVSLLRTCNSSEILKWNGSAWACSTDAGGSGVGDDITVNSVAATNANFLDSSASATAAAITWGLNTVSNPDDITISLGAANGTDAGLVTANAQTFGGAKTFNAQITAGGGIALSASQSLTASGDVIQDFTGNGLQVTSNALNILAQTNRGLTVGASGIGLISSCANNEILKYSTAAGGTWACSTDAGGSGVGDDIQVNGSGVNSTGNFVNVTGDNTHTAVTWGLTPGSPDQITLALGNASTSAEGTVSTGSQTFAGAKAFNNNVTLASTSSFAMNKGTDYATTGAQNNVAISTASLYRLTGATAQTINGIVAGRDGQTLTLVNAGSSAATLVHLAAGQTAGNQINTGTATNVSLPVGSSISLVYDVTSAVWRVIGDASDSGCSTCASIDLNNIANTNLGAALNKTDGTLALQTSGTTGTRDITLTTALNTGLVNVLTGNLKVGNASPDKTTLNGESAYIEGTLEVDGATYFDGNSTMSGTLRLVGNTTVNRPSSPNEGTIYYDTDTKQLLVYANGKWVADGREAISVAANDSSPAAKAAADYIADGTADQVEINNALTAATTATGTNLGSKKVYLYAGTYNTDDVISIPNNTTLSGSGSGTVIKFAALGVGVSRNMITNTDTSTGTGVTIRDLRLDGNRSNNASGGTQRGIVLNGMGGGTGSSARQGALITGVIVASFKSENIYLTNSSNNKISDATSQDSGSEGMQLTSSSSNNTITGSKFQGNAGNGLLANTASVGNTISGNNAQGNTSAGFQLANSSNNTLSSNVANGNASYGFNISVSATNNSVTGNTAQGNTSGGFVISGTSNTLTGNAANGGTNGYNVTANNNTITGNTAQGNTQAIQVSADHTVISGNTINTSSTYGIYLNGANNSTVVANKIYDTGGSTTNNGINVVSSDSNSITNNYISDGSGTTNCSSNCYAIFIFNNTSDTNYLAANSLGNGTINDAGTGTIYANQADGSGNVINKGQGGGFAIGASSATASLTLQGGLVNSQLPAPTLSSTVTNVGTAGGTTYRYQVTALDGTGETTGSSIQQTTTGNATLSGTNYNTITWTQVGGAVQYKIYRCTGAACTPALLATVSGNNVTYNDQANGSPSGAVPSSNTTGGFTIAGALQGVGATFSSTLQVTGAATLTGGATIRGVTVDNATSTDDRILIAVTSNASAARFDGTITNADLTAARTWTFPDVSGTVCIVGSASCLSGAGFVQFAPASAQADTSANSSIFINKTTGSNNLIQLQKSAVDLFVINSSGAIQIGSTGNGITLAGSGGVTTGGFTLNGNAQNSKKIRLMAEYPSVVLDPGSGSGTNLGTMTSGYTASGMSSRPENYYKWTTTQVAAQDYDIVVQVPLPSDFSSWASNTPLTIDVYSSTTSANTIKAYLFDSSAGTPYNGVDITPTSTSTWQQKTPAGDMVTGFTYTAGNYITIKLRLTAPTNGDIRVGNITLDYKAKF